MFRTLDGRELLMLVTRLPAGYARRRYERQLWDKLGDSGDPALYFLDEILALRSKSAVEIAQFHQAKLECAGQRLIQDALLAELHP